MLEFDSEHFSMHITVNLSYRFPPFTDVIMGRVQWLCVTKTVAGHEGGPVPF